MAKLARALSVWLWDFGTWLERRGYRLLRVSVKVQQWAIHKEARG